MKKALSSVAIFLALSAVCCGGTPGPRGRQNSQPVATVRVKPIAAPEEGSRATPLPRRRRPGLLGVHLSRTNEESPGVIVIHAMPGYPAERAGIVPGDVIFSVAGVEVNSYLEVVRAVSKHGAGDSVEVRFGHRSAQIVRSVTLVLAEPPGDPAPEPTEEAPAE